MPAQVTRATPITLPVARANAGIHAWYRRRLEKAVREMHDSFLYWLGAEYKATGLAQDAAGDGGGAAIAMRESVQRLGKRWQRVFDSLADSLARRLTGRVLAHSDNALATGLRGEGFAVKFTMTPAMGDAYQAVLAENVGLIRSIATQYAMDVEGLVMRSVARGRDLGGLTKELRQRYQITQRRAALIARTQNNQATAVLTAARQKSIGVTHGIWRHSHAGKHPRPSHLKAAGERFDLSKGLYLDDEWVLPGTAINCRCTWSPILPGFDE